MRPSRSRAAALLAAVAVTASAAFAAAAPSTPARPAAAAAKGTRATDTFNAKTPPQTPGLPNLDRIDPVKYSYKDAIVEHVQVTARDGVNQIWVDLIRPKTKAGVKVPTIMMASPYFNTLGRGYKAQCKSPHQSPPGGLPTSPGVPVLSTCADQQTPFPEWYDEYFVPRGYAFAAMDLRGTRNSSGCQTYGDRDEVTDAVDVVDWIADQKWSNGRVGMTGGSYDGTIAMGAAVEQPVSGKHKDALAAIIPIRAIDAWYDYHFMNGVQSEGHQATPALFTAALAGADTPNSGTDDLLYPLHLAERKACIGTLGALTDAGYASPYQNANSAFWAERDFRKDAKHIKAATFWIHGLFDFNVKTNNAGNMWLSLPKSLPKKLWLINGDHVDPRCPTAKACADSGHAIPHPMADKFIEANHRWWLQYLKRVPAGALGKYPVEVQGAKGTWTKSRSYPASKSDLVLYPAQNGKLSTQSYGEESSVQWADNPGNVGADASQVFVTAPFKKATRISGQIQFALKYAAAGPDTSIAIRVDDLGPGVDVTERVDDKLYDGDETALTVTYGWLQALVRDSVKPRGPSTPVIGTPLVPEQAVVSKFPSLYTDYVIAKGHRLRFTFSKSDGDSLASNTGNIVTMFIGPKTSSIRLPVVR